MSKTLTFNPFDWKVTIVVKYTQFVAIEECLHHRIHVKLKHDYNRYFLYRLFMLSSLGRSEHIDGFTKAMVFPYQKD